MAFANQNDISQIFSSEEPISGEKLQQLLEKWRNDLMENQSHFQQFTIDFGKRESVLNETNTALLEMDHLLDEFESEMKKFNESVGTLTARNDQLEKEIEVLNKESRSLLKKVPSNMEVEQERTKTYDLMESVDSDLSALENEIRMLKQTIGENNDGATLKMTEEIENCFRELDALQKSIREIHLQDKENDESLSNK